MYWHRNSIVKHMTDLCFRIFKWTINYSPIKSYVVRLVRTLNNAHTKQVLSVEDITIASKCHKNSILPFQVQHLDTLNYKTKERILFLPTSIYLFYKLYTIFYCTSEEHFRQILFCNCLDPNKELISDSPSNFSVSIFLSASESTIKANRRKY